MGLENRLKDVEISTTRLGKGQQELKERMDAGFQEVKKKLKKLENTIDIVQNTVIEHHGIIEKRVDKIEDHLGFAKSEN